MQWSHLPRHSRSLHDLHAHVQLANKQQLADAAGAVALDLQWRYFRFLRTGLHSLCRHSQQNTLQRHKHTAVSAQHKRQALSVAKALHRVR